VHWRGSFRVLSPPPSTKEKPNADSLSSSFHQSFAYVQLSTIIAAVIQKMELKLAGPAMPPPNYEVSTILYLVLLLSTSVERRDETLEELTRFSFRFASRPFIFADDDRASQSSRYDHVPTTSGSFCFGLSGRRVFFGRRGREGGKRVG